MVEQRAYNYLVDAADCQITKWTESELDFTPWLLKNRYDFNTQFDDGDCSKELVDHLKEKRNAYQRIVLPYKAQSKVYTGPWIRQAEYVTCFPHAISNAVLRVGEPINYDFLSDITNVACTEEGLSYNYAEYCLEEYPESGIDFFFDKFYVVTKDLLAKYPAQYRQRIKGNAHIIKEAINNNEALVVGITAIEEYAGIPSNQSHTVTVTGFNINEEHHMDVQLIDPEVGRLWMGLEHLSGSFNPKYVPLAFRVASNRRT